MTKYKLSIIVPALRTPKWSTFYNSIPNACKKHKWEVVFISPFDLPEELKDKDNIKLVKSYSTVCVCHQIGVLAAAEGELIFSTTDDRSFDRGLY